MIAIDTNLWVYAHRADMDQHLAARDAISRALTGVEQVAMCWPVVHEFLSVVTNKKFFPEPTPMELALRQVHGWLSSPVATTLHETSQHLLVLEDMSSQTDISGGKIHDARIAAICVENEVREIWTADRGFEKFDGIRVRNPLL